MTRQRKKPLSQGEKSRMIKARKDCIMKKVEELQNLTELGACLIIPMPNGKFETWPKDGDKLQQVFTLYQENLKSQNQNITNQAERSCCVTTDRQSCHESSAAAAAVEKEQNQYLASDFGNHALVVCTNEDFSTGKELLPWHDETINSLPYSGTEACNWYFDERMMSDTTLDDHTMIQPLQYCYPETNFGSLLYGIPQPTAAPLQVSDHVATLPSFGTTSEFLGGSSNRVFQPYVMPQVFTEYHADHIGGSMHNGERGYHM